MHYQEDLKLADVFAEHGQRAFVFVRPGGNWGDHLIYWGAEYLADRIGLDWTGVDVEDFDPTMIDAAAAVYVHGGGGINPWCSGRAARALLLALESEAAVVIQGPTTYDDDGDYVGRFLASLAQQSVEDRLTVFARERQTLSLLQADDRVACRLGIDDDTAFHITAEAFRARAGIAHGRYPLCITREDNEAPQQHGLACGGIRLDPAVFANSFEHWLRIHAAAKRIVSNRTHSAIAGAILGVPTTIQGGSYHKNRSIWEYSLRPRGVDWSTGEGSDQSGWRAWAGRLKRWVANSWKVRRAMRWLHRVPQS